LRELISNAVDATQKIKHLSSIGEFNGDLGDLKISVALDEEKKTITISDRGIGLTAEEVKKYINQIAFSGATEFVEKYKDNASENSEGIIGNFGLGFYSAYMVAENVEIISKSFKDEPAVKWTCDGSTSFEISDADKTERGSDIILHVEEDAKEFLNKARLQSIINKYCKFLPIEIEFDGAVVNNPNPIWTKSPADLKDEDYIAFYKEMYPMAQEPLFWIHLNVDYPFNLTGILYFPKLANDFEVNKNKIHLYSRQVFITDEVKNIVPEFLMLLHGVIDSPDIPLNVSRSFLQTDGNVRKINNHITKKVADKLNELFKNDRKSFEEKWDDISVFVKYGMISEQKFYDKVSKSCLLKNTTGTYKTIEEYREANQAAQTNKDDQFIYLYTSDHKKQDGFIQSAVKKGYEVAVLDSGIDSHFVNTLEQKLEKASFKRVDSDSADKLIESEVTRDVVLSEDDQKKVKELFEKVINNTGHQVSIEGLSDDELPVTVTLPEFMRRMKEMQATSGMPMMGDMPDAYTVVINGNSPVVAKMLKLESEKQEELAKHTYDLALLAQGVLTGADLTHFIQKSIELVD
jgi:molecular chaperone HtpG